MNERTRRGASVLILALFTTLIVFAFQPFAPVRSEGPPIIFELEFPDFQLSSTQPEITVPSSGVSRVVINVLNPAAANIDYSAIRTSINGRASAMISEVVAGMRGKIVKLDLQRLPGFQFSNGRNTVEVWAENRRGRDFYASFIIKTATENLNDDVTYKFFPSPNAKNEVPPKVWLIEPARAVDLPSSTNRTTVEIKGIANATTTNIVRVSVDGKDLRLKAVPKTNTRELARIPLTETSMAFETAIQVNTNTSQIVIEAEDKLGSRTQVFVPVLSGNLSPRPIVGRKYALIIGVSRYQNNGRGIKNLEFADADARALYEFLQQPEAGKFSRDNMLLLANEDATTTRIREALTSFVSRAEANDVLLIFFAGHGASDPNAPRNHYIITHDTNYFDMSQTAISMADLRRYIESNVKSKQLILLLDACHSAGVSKGVRDLTNNLSNLYLRLLYEGKGRAIITSSDVDEVSNESEEWGNGHGVFTYYLLDGLKGSADENRDRLVTLGELFRYVRDKVQHDTKRQQTPQRMIDNEDLALAIAYQP